MQVKHTCPRRNRRSQSQEKGFLKHLSPQHTWDHVSHKGCSEQMRPWQTAYREQVSNVNIIPSPRNTRHSGQHHDRGTTTCNKQPAPGEWFTEPAQQTTRPRTQRPQKDASDVGSANGDLKEHEQKPAGGLNLQKKKKKAGQNEGKVKRMESQTFHHFSCR